MRTVNLDKLVRAGQRPWRPAPGVSDVEVWDKFDFPTSGAFHLDDDLVVFALITTAGTRSLWAYAPLPPEAEKIIAAARFDSDAEFNDFVAACFADREVIFAAAEDFVITSKSDGTRIGGDRHALLAAGARWYLSRISALQNRPAPQVKADDAEELLLAAQGALANTPT